MTQLKGIELINQILNNFLAKFDATADIGIDFCYWSAKSEINYTLAIGERQNTYFMENFKKLAPDIECDVFLVSLLHELGHHETLADLDDIETIYSLDTKEQLYRELNEMTIIDIEKEEKIYQMYFSLPDEYEATMWAVEYIRTHDEEIAKFWNELRSAIIEFYKINGIEVD